MPKKKIANLVPVFSPMRLKYKDIFDLKDLYKTIREYLLEHGWGDQEDPGTDHWESLYLEKVDQKGVKEYWFRWRCIKDPPQQAMLRYYLDFDWHCVAITQTEVIRNGHKLKVQNGEVEIYFKAFIEELYKKDFDGNFILKQIKELFDRRVYSTTLERRKKELYQEVYSMQNFLKQWFKLKRYLPYEETQNFFPSRAWPQHIKDQQ